MEKKTAMNEKARKIIKFSTLLYLNYFLHFLSFNTFYLHNQPSKDTLVKKKMPLAKNFILQTFGIDISHFKCSKNVSFLNLFLASNLITGQ